MNFDTSDRVRFVLSVLALIISVGTLTAAGIAFALGY